MRTIQGVRCGAAVRRTRRPAAPSTRARELQAFHVAEIRDVFNVVPSADSRDTGSTYTVIDRELANIVSSTR